ncbi:P-loop containing nucleoside triphosphate hydrolase [Glarea lozoyensis ATCC 20868]|uniref:Translation initiation factor IF-2, mitochondrial n=1 Tax=Glarea lozoyensis (strain ATCC 20868 / MF5171) TaxID=1116229 RepID=S3CNG5_GLAL2|nr:P-loop containing nucleoside triphosphate hydrolase [Glarea lozoyensis ATCC 20868]EPE26719.1 P-loop containing nucleoside triphosphate hydrolase [Glarea lozoyensis ATCC 20868]
MRGKTLVRESQCSSICAFCAHRLGQASQTFHVQRRFLQSSRATSRPPAEGAALRENTDDKHNSQPGNWQGPVVGVGRGNGKGPVNRNAPSWGRGSVPGRGSIPSGGWGRPGLGGVPRGVPATRVLNNAGETAPVPDLLPHEQRARDLMLGKEAEAQQRKVNIPMGPGPQATRSGRYEPRTEDERARIARNSLERRNAREAQDLHDGRRSDVLNGASFTLRKFPTGLAPEEDRSSSDKPKPSEWSQLRRREQATSAPENPAVAREKRFREGRREREEQSRWGRYTPLGTVSRPEVSRDGYKPRSEPEYQPRYGRYTPTNTISQLEVSRDGYRPRPNRFVPSSDPSVYDSKPQFQQESSSDFAVRDKAVETPEMRETLVSYKAFRAVENDSQPQEVLAESTTKQVVEKEDEKKEAEQEDEDTQPTRERRKKKTRRGKSENVEASYGKPAKGGDRDKARRRQQFVQEEDEEALEIAREEARLRAEAKAERKREKAAKKPVPIMLPEFISVSNLAIALRVRQEDFVAKMTELGFEEVHHDFILNAENAGLIAQEYNFEPIIDRGESEDLKAMDPPADTSNLPSRPPVVTIMGHVDHGKTTILDYLRKSSVAATEHGGITQHIGAFSVPMPSGKTITFLDTPGHAAFLSMRQRGANVTDIVILVVAADDSVMPQTVEAINHAKAAKVPIIVAVNKIDKEDSDVEKVKQDLARHGVDVEDYGGDTQVVCVSGKTGQGMDELEEAAVALSDILDMRADRDCPAEGWVIEASIKSMGKCATVLVRCGTMRPGDFIVAGTTWARIRCLRNEAGVDIEEAGPGMPVEIDGWREQPLAGDEVLQAPDEGKAKSVVDYRLEREERNRLAEDMEAINESRKVESDKKTREKLETQAASEGVTLEIPEQKVGGPKEIYFIVKGDVSGSVEAVVDSISALGNKEVHPYVLRSGVGQVSEFDIEHASAAKGHIINFNTEIDPHILRSADAAKVKIIDQNIIYRLVDEVKAKLSEHLPPLVTQKVIGEADIAQVFSITVKGRQVKNVAGCKVRNGTIAKNARVRVLRRGEKVFDGAILTLKNVKRDVAEMKKGTECGISFEDWTDFETGDQIQTYEQKEEKRYL